MSLPKDFWDLLPLKTDSELYEMLAHRDDYLPEALAAAKNELSKRNLAPEAAAQAEAAVQSEMAEAEANAEETLSWPMRIFIFFFCAGISGAVFAAYYDSKGYHRKASDCWIILFASIVFHLFAGVLLYARR